MPPDLCIVNEQREVCVLSAFLPSFLTAETKFRLSLVYCVYGYV